jgi:uncharacterized protein YqgC (DUF456 family)
MRSRSNIGIKIITMPDVEVVMSIIAMATVAIGIFGLFAPSVPGMILIWAGIFLYSVVTEFSKISVRFFAAITAVTILLLILDHLQRIWIPRHHLQTAHVIIGALIGGMVSAGTNHISIIFLSTLVGGLIAEILVKRESIFMVETRRQRLYGFFMLTILKLTLGITIAGSFLQRILLS